MYLLYCSDCIKLLRVNTYYTLKLEMKKSVTFTYRIVLYYICCNVLSLGNKSFAFNKQFAHFNHRLLFLRKLSINSNWIQYMWIGTQSTALVVTSVLNIGAGQSRGVQLQKLASLFMQQPVNIKFEIYLSACSRLMTVNHIRQSINLTICSSTVMIIFIPEYCTTTDNTFRSYICK